MGTLKTKDGTQIYYKDWGAGKPVAFNHGWPLNADSWEGQMLFLASHGYRGIAHDRRGHGRFSQSLKIHSGAPHGLTDTHKHQLDVDLLAFCQGAQTQTQAR